MDRPKRDEIFELKIEDIGSEGNGIGRINGEFVVFVPKTVPGDIVKAKIRKTKKNYSEAKLVEITEPSASRVVPECRYFGTCNGCKMQNIEYKTQLKIKKNIVKNSYERIGGFTGIDIPDVIGSANIYYYRNKLEFSFSADRWLTEEDMNNENADRSFALGYHIPGFYEKILDINECCLQSDISNRILNCTREFFKSRNISVYSTKTGTGFLRYLVIRQSAKTNDLMVNLITFEDDRGLIEKYAETLKKEVPEITTLINSISTSKAQVAQFEISNTIFGKGFIEEMIGNYSFKVMPGTFFQTNSGQCDKLFQKVVEFAKFEKNENVLDLYCGCGAISLYISGYVNKVYGVELGIDSVEMAKENAALNNVRNCEFETSDVKDFLQNHIDKSTHKWNTFILDPPRSGIHPKAAEYILAYGPKKIIYVSCSPGTQARDLMLLAPKYEITAIQPVDMFPHTFHIENVVRLDLKS